MKNRELQGLLDRVVTDEKFDMSMAEVDRILDRAIRGTARSKPVRDPRTPEERARDQKRAINANLQRLAAKRAAKPVRVK